MNEDPFTSVTLSLPSKIIKLAILTRDSSTKQWDALLAIRATIGSY